MIKKLDTDYLFLGSELDMEKIFVSLKLMDKLEKEEREIGHSTQIELARHIELLGRMSWIYKNFPQFNIGWVHGYPGDFQCGSDEEIELTEQQRIDYENSGHFAVVDFYKNDNKGYSKYLEFLRQEVPNSSRC